MTTVIMGGTSGIGRAVAEAFGPGQITVTGRDGEKLAALRTAGYEAARVDGTVPSKVASFFKEQGPFEHLVLAFSPGAVGFGPLGDISVDDVRTAFEGKLFAYLSILQHAQVTESVTMISAAGGRAAMPGTVALAAVNGAIDRIVPPLAAELAPIRVNAVSPGLIDTPWWAFLPPSQRAVQFETTAATLPIPRIGTPEDVAQAVRYLIEATYVTGTTLAVDGGFTLT